MSFRYTTLAMVLGGILASSNTDAQVNEGFESYGDGFGLITPASAFVPWIYYGHNLSSWRPRMMHRNDPSALFNFPTTNLDPESHGGAPNDHYVKIYANPGSAGTGAGSAGTPNDPLRYHRGIYRELPEPIQPGTYQLEARINVNYPGSTGQTMAIRTVAVLADMTTNAFYMGYNWQNNPMDIPGAEYFGMNSQHVSTSQVSQTWVKIGGTIFVNEPHDAFYLDIEFREMEECATTFSYRLDELLLIPVEDGLIEAAGSEQAETRKHSYNLLTAPFASPNPTSGAFDLYTTDVPANTPVQVIAADGRIVRTLSTTDDRRLTIDLTAEPVGLYSVRILEEGREHTVRVVRE